MGRSYGVVGVAQRSLASEGAGCLTIKSGRSSGTRELPVIIFGVMFAFLRLRSTLAALFVERLPRKLLQLHGPVMNTRIRFRIQQLLSIYSSAFYGG